MLVHQFIEREASINPTQIAIVTPVGQLTFAELNDRSTHFGSAMQQLGVRHHDRVLIALDNSLEAVITMLATLQIGAVMTLVHPQTKANRAATILVDASPRLVVIGNRQLAEFSDALASAALTCPVLIADSGEPAELANGSFGQPWLQPQTVQPLAPPDSIDVDLAAIIYTSGSTGEPKGVMIAHDGMRSTIETLGSTLELSRDDRVLNVLPVTMGYGLYEVLATLCFGATLHLERSLASPYAVLSRAAVNGVTGFSVVPSMIALLQQMDRIPPTLPDLRYITTSSSGMSISQMDWLRSTFPTTTIYAMYGLTECLRALCAKLAPGEEFDGAVGRPTSNVDAYLVDDDDRVVSPGGTGQLVLRGNNIMRGYWRSPSATNRAIRPSPVPGSVSLYTGDLFRCDRDGRFFFLSRLDGIIKVGGQRVSPMEVEHVVCGYGKILAASMRRERDGRVKFQAA